MPRYLFVLLCLCAMSSVQAEIYKRVDANGHVTYSSEPLKGGKKLDLLPLPVMQSQRSGPKDFPKVDSETQKNRDSTRRTILEDELATEEKLLAEARQHLQEAESNPEISHGPDGKTYRNVAKYEENVKTAKDEIATHEQNIQALKTEIANLH